MKKLIYISGIASANLMLVSVLFKILHYPGAGVLLILATALFCFFFLPAALMSAYKNEGQKKYAATYIVTFIVFFCGMMGVLFKVLHWPGASIFVLIGVPLPFLLFLPVYLYQTRSDKKSDSTNFLGIMFGLIFLAVFSVLLALKVSSNVLDHAALNTANQAQVSAYHLAKLSNVSDENGIVQSSDEVCDYIEELKCELLTAAGNDFCENNQLRKDFHPFNIENKSLAGISKNILYRPDNNNLEGLKSKIEKYRTLLLTEEKVTPALKDLINALLDVSDQPVSHPGSNETIAWEQREFPSFEVILVIDALTQIQSNIRLLEAEILF